MTGPLIPMGVIGQGWDLVIALIIGMAFGYVLESAGFSSSRKLAGVFYGYDFTVLRVFFTAAITAMVGLLYFGYMGWLDLNMIYINETYLYAVLIGGVVMGAGFITGGYCPGTSLCAVAIGKIDAMVFTAGMFIGILFFSEIFGAIEFLYTGNYLGPVTVYEVLGMPSGLFALLLIAIALVAFVVTAWLQKRITKTEN